MIVLDQLIIELILIDLQHNQLMIKLREIMLDDQDEHSLYIMPVVEELMGGMYINVADEFETIYSYHMSQFYDFSDFVSRTDLRPLAVECFKELKELMDEKSPW